MNRTERQLLTHHQFGNSQRHRHMNSHECRPAAAERVPPVSHGYLARPSVPRHIHAEQRFLQPTASPTLAHTRVPMASLDRLSHVATHQQADVVARLAARPESVRLPTQVQSVALVSKRARLRRVRGLSAEYRVAVHWHGPRTRRWFRDRPRRSRPVQSVGRDYERGRPRRV